MVLGWVYVCSVGHPRVWVALGWATDWPEGHLRVWDGSMRGPFESYEAPRMGCLDASGLSYGPEIGRHVANGSF
jgi:hypothetical protein